MHLEVICVCVCVCVTSSFGVMDGKSQPNYNIEALCHEIVTVAVISFYFYLESRDDLIFIKCFFPSFTRSLAHSSHSAVERDNFKETALNNRS